MKETHEVIWRGQAIRFVLQRKKVRNINLNLKPDMTLVVSANETVPLEYIQEFIKSKGLWIQKNISYFKDTQPEFIRDKEYVSGETFKYLGKQVRLKVLEGEHERIRYFRGYLELCVKDKMDTRKKELLVSRWFRERAAILFQAAIGRVYPLIQKYGVHQPELLIRTMRARWGSCVRDKGIILLNYELIKAPKYCIEYVVLHELSHFLYRNHDAKFFSFLSSLMPDWRERKRILDEEVIRSL